MPGYKIHEALQQSCEIRGPLVRGSGPRTGPVWLYSIKVLNL